jgi:hypothetical protein
LSNTGMALSELAFHEAINFTYFEVGMGVLGGTNLTPGEPVHWGLDGKPREVQSEEEFRRATIEHLLMVARDNAEVFRQWAEMNAEEAERWQKIIEIAARIMRGDNVPQSDKAFLGEHSPGLLMMAMSSRNPDNENPTDYDAIAPREDSDRRIGIATQSAASESQQQIASLYAANLGGNN